GHRIVVQRTIGGESRQPAEALAAQVVQFGRGEGSCHGLSIKHIITYVQTLPGCAKLETPTVTEPQRTDVFDRAVPLQHQIYLQMRQEIADGLWTGRADFPGEKELARRFDVSVITTKAALNGLAEEGWVERRRGRRTRAVRLPAETPPASPQLLPVGPRRDYRYQVIFAGEAVAPLDACQAFG